MGFDKRSNLSLSIMHGLRLICVYWPNLAPRSGSNPKLDKLPI